MNIIGQDENTQYMFVQIRNAKPRSHDISKDLEKKRKKISNNEREVA